MVGNDNESKDDKFQAMPDELIDWLSKPLGRFLHIETAAAGVLLIATLLAMLLANSPWSAQYFAVWQTEFGIALGQVEFRMTLGEWINDAVMTLFFFLVSLELKRELVLGELSHPREAMLSVSAAIGGMLVPAAIYLLLTAGEPAAHGWGMVMATDTAFVIGCLALMGKHIPQQLRIFLLSLAIVDDIGAILVVAIGYGDALNYQALLAALIALIAVRAMTLLGIRNLMLYFMVGTMAWFAVEHSGIHPTVTGVILGLMTPTTKWVNEERLFKIFKHVVTHPHGQDWSGDIQARMALSTAEAAAREALSPVERLEILLHPWVGFAVMPLFAFANAGIPLDGLTVFAPLTGVIVISLAVGKPLGIYLFSWLAIRLHIGLRPKELTWPLLLAGGCLCGIGFTMSLFIAGLAFSPAHIDEAKVGILVASVISAVIGLFLIKLTLVYRGK
ncbi:Na+/H+ antiporter NhaA [Shewanella litorisediminis]|uniref:Na(+)/H(+) antiporter NhaA n=1 Tax=Shewanella litorisediminis TaxID=1173586 RepID=A0ABX7G689_9GAMM|nr:Na+/H+ antiporter NhaA [Shewanella litorisediminis]MCL2917623.1 Na+/H+ antiporter NhaA [Shewanella litorisediminis]QRH02748.1 Na+/H+ antiporter NhaA [Shewanella litorisediminis]